jgi:hypothetical protein
MKSDSIALALISTCMAYLAFVLNLIQSQIVH